MRTAALAIATVLLALAPRALAHDPATPAPTLVVTGAATIDAEPDQLEITLAVVSQADNVEDAMQDNSRRMARVLEALRRQGLEDHQLETVGFNIQPSYNYDRTGQTPPRITGYAVSNTVLATTPRLELAGDLIEAAVKAGANNVSGLSFGLQNPQNHRARAIAEATAAARADAEALAAAANLTLSGVLEITLDPDHAGYRPFTATREMAAMSDAAPPITPGDVSLSARVRIVYRVADSSR